MWSREIHIHIFHLTFILKKELLSHYRYCTVTHSCIAQTSIFQTYCLKINNQINIYIYQVQVAFGSFTKGCDGVISYTQLTNRYPTTHAWQTRNRMQLKGKSAHPPTQCTLPWEECDLGDTNLLFSHSNSHEHLLVGAPCCTSVILMFQNTMESHNTASKCKSILSCLQWKKQQTVPMLGKTLI